MKKSPNNLLKASLIGYLLLLTFCNTDHTLLTKDEANLYLADKYGAVILSEIPITASNNTMISLLETTTVIDTVVFSAGIDIHGHFLKAFVYNKDSKKCFAQFYCSEAVYDKYINSTTTLFSIAAKLSKVTFTETHLEAESIEGNSLFFDSQEEIFFNGECLELVENKSVLPNENMSFNQS